MFRTIPVFSLALVVLAIFDASNVDAADPIKGKAKAKAVCQTCHGMDGIATTPVAANLSGQQEIYMRIQLERYRAGKREDPQMNIIAQMLSDEDIENVAAYYSGIRVTIEIPE